MRPAPDRLRARPVRGAVNSLSRAPREGLLSRAESLIGSSAGSIVPRVSPLPAQGDISGEVLRITNRF